MDNKFKYIQVVGTTEEISKTINLFWGDYCVAWVNNIEVAEEIKEFLNSEKKKHEKTRNN